MVSKAVDGEGRAGAQDGSDIVRIGDLVEHDDEALLGKLGNVKRRQRLGLEQQALMHGVARQPRGDLLGGDDPRLDAAAGDLGAQPLGRRRRRVEAHQTAARGVERRQNRVEAIEAGDAGAAVFARAMLPVPGHQAPGSIARTAASKASKL